VLVDRNDWFKALQQRVINASYPDQLVRAVVAKNFPVLGPIISSYEDQIESAFARRDVVSLIHRTAAWLASYFDIVLAANPQYHTGEKRLLVQATRLSSSPANMVDDVTRVCSTASDLQNCVAVISKRLGRGLPNGWRRKAFCDK
jgi:hypothetical protein